MSEIIPDVKEIYFSEEQLAARVAELGAEITRDLKGEELCVVGVLKGAAVFTSDLLRRIELKTSLDFVACSAYRNKTAPEGDVQLNKDLGDDIEGKNVLVVEDILDTGKTLSFLMERLKAKKPASLRLCILLDKPSRRLPGIEIKADYCGFTIPDAFVVGYGMDYAERYRNLPYIGVLKPEVYE